MTKDELKEIFRELLTEVKETPTNKELRNKIKALGMEIFRLQNRHRKRGLALARLKARLKAIKEVAPETVAQTEKIVPFKR